MRIIRRLTSSPTWEEARAYLRWLAHSPFEYHLDDSPEDIESFTWFQRRQLSRNAKALRSLVKGYDDWNTIWEWYWEELTAAGKTLTEE